MKIGLIPINIGFDSADPMIEAAQAAESVGVESLWTFEHAIIPLEYESKYPYTADGRMAAFPEMNLIDPLIALAAVAGATKTIRLGTGVNILSQVNPLMMAKQAAGLDFASNGRFMLGVGIGWLREEFDAMGTPFERRGERFDDYVIAMKKMWSGDVVEHDSDFINWTNFKSYPLPVQKSVNGGNPGVPIIIGGNKGKAFERVAKQGAGWFAPSVSPEELAPYMDTLADACKAEGRDPKTVEVTAMWAMQGGMDTVKQFEDLGVERLNIPIQVMGGGDMVDNIKRLGDDLLAKM